MRRKSAAAIAAPPSVSRNRRRSAERVHSNAAPPKRGERGQKPDPVAELTQEDVRRLAIGGVRPGVVMRAEVRQPIDDDRAQEREQREGAERGRRRRVLPAEARARLSAIEKTSIASMIAIPAAANAYQRRKANIANRVSASAKATRRVIGAIRASWPCAQREQAGEALGQPQRADDEHEPADIGHAARRDRHRGRKGEEIGGDGEAPGRPRPRRRERQGRARRARSRARIASASSAGAA